MNKTLDFPFELKEIKPNGIFRGYGSVFGVLDYYDEVVAPGAFVDSLAQQEAKGRMPAMLWQHQSAEPLGAFTEMVEDQIGLKVVGQLALKTVRGAEAYELMTMKPRPAITGLSIGYQTREESFDKVSGINTLKKVDLWEVSLVTFPANDAARIQGVKSIETIEDLKSAEKYLRDAGFSRKEAVAFIGRIKSLGQSDSDEGEMQQFIEAIIRRGEIIAV